MASAPGKTALDYKEINMNILDIWREKRRNRVAFTELSMLSERVLDDIGLTRADLEKLRRGRPAGKA